MTNRMNIPFSPPDITNAEVEQVISALKSGWITTGPKTKEFERKISEVCGTNKTVCLNSATAAMELTLYALGIGPGDEVITCAYTYTATASMSQYAIKGIKERNYTKFKIGANATVWVFALVGFIIGFAGSMSTSGLQTAISYIPEWLISGFSVAGVMLPAIGFAMILSVMAKIELLPFVLIGYICIGYLQLPVMGVAFVGTAVALLVYYIKGNSNDSNDNDGEVIFEDGI